MKGARGRTARTCFFDILRIDRSDQKMSALRNQVTEKPTRFLERRGLLRLSVIVPGNFHLSWISEFRQTHKVSRVFGRHGYAFGQIQPPGALIAPPSLRRRQAGSGRTENPPQLLGALSRRMRGKHPRALRYRRRPFAPWSCRADRQDGCGGIGNRPPGFQGYSQTNWPRSRYR